MLPATVIDKITWEYGEFERQPLALRNWIWERTQLLQWDETPARGKAHVLDGGCGGGEARDQLEHLCQHGLNADLPDGEMAALVRRKLWDARRRCNSTEVRKCRLEESGRPEARKT